MGPLENTFGVGHAPHASSMPGNRRRDRQDVHAPLTSLCDELANHDGRTQILAAIVHELTACLAEVRDGLKRLEENVDAALNQADRNQPALAWLDVPAAAKALGLAEWTTRNYLRLGRIAGERATTYRGVDREWRVSVDEIKFIREHGLRPARYPR